MLAHIHYEQYHEHKYCWQSTWNTERHICPLNCQRRRGGCCQLGRGHCKPRTSSVCLNGRVWVSSLRPSYFCQVAPKFINEHWAQDHSCLGTFSIRSPSCLIWRGMTVSEFARDGNGDVDSLFFFLGFPPKCNRTSRPLVYRLVCGPL